MAISELLEANIRFQRTKTAATQLVKKTINATVVYSY